MILEELDENNNTYPEVQEPVIQDENGMWVVDDENKAPYPLNSSMFPVQWRILTHG